ncbi:MAG: hypothetical protein M3041_10420, partial [Acidobacteriota bacterium]|nr:hypothetical protein [Acidobacteriota bacterium]
QLLDELRKPSTVAPMNAADTQAQVAQIRTELGQMINQMNELFQIVSRNMTPSTQLFTLTAPASTRTARSVSARTLTLYGILVFLVSIPTVIVACVLHNRVREEELNESKAAA